MLIAVGSKSGQTAQLELGNFANARILDELRRVEGVGSVQVFASPYAMRIWLDPEKLANYSLSAAEALAAVQEQNSQSPGGQIGDLPISGETELNAAILTQSRFTTPEQSGNIILRANPDGSAVRSEEHTSELQSLMRISYAVFCLKKKKNINKKNIAKSK